MCRSMADIRSTAAEIRRGKKEEEDRRKKLQGKSKMAPLLHRVAIIITSDQSNLTTCHIAAALLHTDHSIVFTRLCLCAKQCFLGPSQVHIPNCISISSADSTYILQWATPSPLQNCLFPWVIWTSRNTSLLGPKQHS